ncbi:hypothetical protein G9A89_004831 [Geosiphon pyriformis]|nr:hypothetical protein G9A89_004831 [Geosiphon pyriformis]
MANHHQTLLQILCVGKIWQTKTTRQMGQYTIKLYPITKPLELKVEEDLITKNMLFQDSTEDTKTE